MPYDAQGKPHHSASRAAFSDKANEGKKPTPQPKGEKPAGEGKTGGEHDVSGMHIRDVVKQFGPAHEMHSEHDHEANSHKVHSIHGEKHHRSEHDTADAAHHHMGMAIGANPQQQEPEESPDQSNAQPQMASAGSIPGMD